ncbi:carboxymuconolactone decarboxylase family protein [Nocardioides sp.]|uniref:carboxymuconolactone decarboxylase family protein n=1 Tax=Nocardioides sp. TaxID=35761 RepID=UPI003D1086D3
MSSAEDVARSILGDAQVEETKASVTEFNADWEDYLSRTAGSIWSREGLDRRTKSAVTLALLTALGREEELAVHVRVGLRNGLTPHEISEILIHTSLYAGVPFVRAAFAIAGGVVGQEPAAPPEESSSPPAG